MPGHQSRSGEESSGEQARWNIPHQTVEQWKVRAVNCSLERRNWALSHSQRGGRIRVCRSLQHIQNFGRLGTTLRFQQFGGAQRGAANNLTISTELSCHNTKRDWVRCSLLDPEIRYSNLPSHSSVGCPATNSRCREDAAIWTWDNSYVDFPRLF